MSYNFLGDSGYPLQPWLLTPIDNAAPGTREELYNTLHSRARSIIECVNGILKSRFRCLLRHRTLNYDPIKAANIIYTCAVLHNISIAFNDELPNDNIDLQEQNNNGMDNDNAPIPSKKKTVKNYQYIIIYVYVLDPPNIFDGNWHVQGQRIRNNLIQLLN